MKKDLVNRIMQPTTAIFCIILACVFFIDSHKLTEIGLQTSRSSIFFSAFILCAIGFLFFISGILFFIKTFKK